VATLGGLFSEFPLDRGIDLDELVAVPKELHAQKGGGRNLVGEPLSDAVPGIQQILVLADNVNGQLSNIFECETVDLNEGAKVVETYSCLTARIANAHHLRVVIERDLASDEESVADRVGVSVARCWCQTCLKLCIVHVRNISTVENPFDGCSRPARL
jgi:hypothetical protein